MTPDVVSLRRRAQTGDVEAMYALARALLKGDGCDQNIPEHMVWMQRAAEQDYPDALMDLAFYYSFGDHGLPKMPLRKIPLYEKAIRNGPAKYPLKTRTVSYARAFLAETLIVERQQSELGQPFELMRQAADEGLDYAVEGCGLMMLFGEGCVQDIETGLSYLRHAASTRESARDLLLKRRIYGIHIFDKGLTLKKDEGGRSYVDMDDVPGLGDYLKKNPGSLSVMAVPPLPSSVSGSPAFSSASPAAAGVQAPTAAGNVPAPMAQDAPVMTVDEAKAQLETMVGLDSVKAQIRALIDRHLFDRLREKQGLATQAANLHLVFTGNPGTGKTTVARILGAILHGAGVLPKGHVVEVSDYDLIGTYVGEATPRVEACVKQAMGGILFIDEAYNMLTSVGKNGAQHSASMNGITSLLQQMEMHAGKFMVIAAGYPEQMQDFLLFNPGLKSRFREIVHFDNFSGPELVDIFKRLAVKKEYVLGEGCEAVLSNIMQAAPSFYAKHFGNARFVHNLFEETLERVASRVVRMENPTRDDLMMVTPFDIQSAAEDFRQQDMRSRKA